MRLAAAHEDLENYLVGPRWYQESASTRAAVPTLDRVLLPGVRDHRGAAAVLRWSRHPRRRPPQGRQRHGRADHRGRPVLPARVLPPVAVARGLAAGDLSGQRPRRAAAHAAARRRRLGSARDGRPSRRQVPRRADLDRPGRPRTPAAARLQHRAQRRSRRRRDGPAVRRWRGAPVAAGDAARDRRCAGPAAVQPDQRCAGTRGVPHQRGPRRLPRSRADPRARAAGGPRLRHRPGDHPRRHGVHHPHPGAGRDRPVPRRADRAVLRRRQRRARGTGQPDPRARRRDLPRWGHECVQHGGDGPAAGPAGQRGQRAAR